MPPGFCSRGRNGAAPRCTTLQLNAHRTVRRELLYPWHPWSGLRVRIHEAVEKGEVAVFRCSLSGRASERWLEVPAWMFDRTADAGWRIEASPQVDLFVLISLAGLLQNAGAPSQSRDMGAALRSHDTNRGDLNAAPAHPTSVRPVLQPARGADAAMADVAGRNAPAAHQTVGSPHSRTRRRQTRHSTRGGEP